MWRVPREALTSRPDSPTHQLHLSGSRLSSRASVSPSTRREQLSPPCTRRSEAGAAWWPHSRAPVAGLLATAKALPVASGSVFLQVGEGACSAPPIPQLSLEQLDCA